MFVSVAKMKCHWSTGVTLSMKNLIGLVPSAPFLHTDNHLNLARELGWGTNHLEEIAIVGAAINDVRHEFKPCWV